MDLRLVAILLPGEGLGEFPTDLGEQDAAQALHAWTAAWHPELILATGRVPGVWSTSALPDAVDASDAVLILPNFARTHEVSRWQEDLAQADENRTLVIDSFASREQIIAKARAASIELATCDGHWTPEFYALGYAYLQTELLTQSLVFPSVINGDDLEGAIVAAARAAVAREDDKVEKHLRTVYDLLEQVREHVYPVETSLLDVVLLGETTIGERLDAELSTPTPKSYIVNQETAALLQQREKAGSLAQQCLLATHPRDADLELAPPGDLQAQVQHALLAIEEAFGKAASAFALTAASLPARLSDVLSAVGTPLFAVQLTPGRGVRCDQPRFVWKEPHRFDLEALIATPRDAASARTLLRHAKRLGDSLYRDHISTEVFAAWAGARHELFADLRIVAQRSGLLGRFQTVDEYFRQTEGAAPEGQVADEELGPRGQLESADGLLTLSESDLTANAAGLTTCILDLLALPSNPNGVDGGAAGSLASVASALLDADQPSRRIVSNPLSIQRAVVLADGQVGKPCDLVSSDFVPSVPGLGYRVASLSAQQSPPAARDAQRAQGGIVRNEHLELAADDQSGGIKSLRTHKSRRNRLALKPVARRGEKLIDVPLQYRCESTEVVANTFDRGIVRTQSTMSDLRGGLVCRCSIQLALLAGWNRLFVDVEFDVSDATTKLDDLHYAVRVALPAGNHGVYRGVQWARLPEHRRRFAVSDYLQIAEGRESVTLAAGSPLGCLRQGPRMIDLFLPVEKEGKRRHRLGIALDETQPLRPALEVAAQSLACGATTCQSGESSAWIAHIDSPNVQVLSITPLSTGERGVRLSVLETLGRSTDARARFARRPQAAWLVDHRGVRRGALDLVGEAVVLPLAAHQWAVFEVTW